MDIRKITDAGRIAVMGYCTVFVLENFHFGFDPEVISLLWCGVAVLTGITLLQGLGGKTTRETIQTVFEMKGVKVGDKYPKYVRGE